MAENETEICVFEEVGRRSDGLIYFSAAYSSFCVLLILVTCFLWLRLQHKLIYLEKRGYVLFLLLNLGFIFNILAGPLARTQSSPNSLLQRCPFTNFFFLLTFPTLTLGAIIGTFMFTRRVRVGKILAKASDTNHEISLKQLNRAWYLSTNKFAVILSTVCFFLISMICFGITYTLCPELGGDECIIAVITEPAILFVFLSSFIALCILIIYIARKLKTYPDPFNILRSVRNGLLLALVVQFPGLTLSIFDVGEPSAEDKEEINFTYGLTFDFPILAVYLYFGLYQIVKALKFNALQDVYSDTDLRKVLNDSTGRKLFREHLINEFNYENLVFIEDIEEYKSKESADERFAKAKEIYETHFKYSRLNISYDVKVEIERRYKDEEINKDMFNEAENEIWNLLESDTFHRFQQSIAFRIYVGTQHNTSTVVTAVSQPHKNSQVSLSHLALSTNISRHNTEVESSAFLSHPATSEDEL